MRATVDGRPVRTVRRRANWRNKSSPKPKPYRPLMSRSREMSITRSSNCPCSTRARSSRGGAAAWMPAAESRPVSTSRSGRVAAGSRRSPSSAISLAASRHTWRPLARSHMGRTIVRCCQRLSPRLPAAISSENTTRKVSVRAEPALSQPQWSAIACAVASIPPTIGATSRTAATVGRWSYSVGREDGAATQSARGGSYEANPDVIGRHALSFPVTGSS